jgi:hypothetical protein
MKPELRRQGIRLNTELLQRIGKRERQIYIAEGIVIIAAVKEKIETIRLAAGNRKGARSVRTLYVFAPG